MRFRRVKPIQIHSHPNFYNKMEEIRLKYKQNNINLSQSEITNLISKRIRIPNINLIRSKNVKKQKR